MFKRLFKVTESNINSAIDQLEDPIKMTEQGIRDLKKDLTAAMESLAQVKAMAIRTRKEANGKQQLASAYGDMVEQTDTLDNEIDLALADKETKGSAMLDALKKRMDIDQ